MDSTGREHLVHSILLRLKIPLFRYMEMEPSSTILMDFASSEVVDFLCEVVYGSDRWFIKIARGGFGVKANSTSYRTNVVLVLKQLFHQSYC